LNAQKSPEEIAHDRAENRKENIIAIAVVVVVIAAIGWWLYAARFAPRVDDDVRVQVNVGDSPVLGNASAPVVVVVFSDFECPFCGEFARDELPKLKAQYIDTGIVALVYKQFPIAESHPKALRAAQAAVCAHQQGAFFAYHDLLYGHQDALEIGNLLGYAQDLGLDMDRFKECVISEEALPIVIREKDQGIKAAVAGTPTFFFNGRRVVGALTAEEFGAQVAKELD
jgi:protein-disulfide isomerase